MVTIALAAVTFTVDFSTPAGISVGILFAIPILISSQSKSPREILLTAALCFTAYIVGIVFGEPPIVPRAVWLPNRVFSFLVLSTAIVLALLLQRVREAALHARAQATARGELNRLLLALVSHDLRSPLGNAAQAIEYVIGCVEQGVQPEPALLTMTEQRVRRGLRSTEMALEIVRRDLVQLDNGSKPLLVSGERLVRELEEETLTFAAEAETAGKVIRTDWSGLADVAADPVVLRQALSIVIDNALRHARPGTIRVHASTEPDRLCIRVEDPGTAATASGDVGGFNHPGAGLGLRLCNALLAGADGCVRVEPGRDGTVAEIWIGTGYHGR